MRVGLIINPIAGLGGPAALKGTDGPGVADEALARGAVPTAQARALTFLRCLSAARSLAWLAAEGPMGADCLASAGMKGETVACIRGTTTTATDTQRAAMAMVERGCELIVFAGGDGTARDVHDAVGSRVPILGIPAGVKMHSAVFAASPGAAAAVVEALQRQGAVTVREAEVMDIDEADLRQGHVSARLVGYARVPYVRAAMPGPKMRSAAEDAELPGAAAEVVAAMQPGVTYIVGPGTTMRLVKRALGCEGTLLGCDAFLDRHPAALDLTAPQLLALADRGPMRILVGVTGGQGFILGRGNQQLTPELLRRVGRDGLIIVASSGKLAALGGAPLRVDTGDEELDRALAGHVRVITGAGQSAVMRIAGSQAG